MSKKKREDTGRERVGDPRIGKRVFCVSLLPALHAFGTIQSIVRYPNGMEYWKVLTEHGMIGDGPSTEFVLYEQAPELHAGDRVGVPSG